MVFTISISMWHIFNVQHSHIYYPIYYWYQKPSFSFFQQLNDSFSIFRCCSWILSDVIRQKWFKLSITCATVRRWWGYFLVCGTKVLQSNAFNRHRSISTIVFWFNPVYKTGYYMLFIITTAHHILALCKTLEGLLVCVTTVIYSNNAYMW